MVEPITLRIAVLCDLETVREQSGRDLKCKYISKDE